jgi:hypothetical protein
MAHAYSMAAAQVERTAGTPCFEAAVEKMRDGVQAMADWIGAAGGEALGEGLIQIRESGINPLEAVFANGVRRFDQSGEYKGDGAVSLIAWLKWKCKLSGGAAAERVEIARQLEKLPKTEAAFANGDLGYQHVALIARTAEHVGAAVVQREEGRLVQAAQTHDPGQFLGVTKNFEHRVDPEGALTEANQAHARRYLHLGEPQNGMVRLDGLLDAEGGATLRSALEPFMKPTKADDRSFGQRQHDALIELCRQRASGKRDGTGPRPQLIIRASVDTLAGLAGGGTVPAATVQRYACDTALIRITGRGELEHELTHATRTIPPSTRRALEARDQHCVFEGCDRRLNWCDGHHLVWWIKGGPTTLSNLALLCRPHHRMVHEEGWTLERRDGRFRAIPPPRSVRPRSRST